MRYRKLTADGDYSFGNGQLDFYRDEPAAVGQAALTRTLLWLGEWFLDIDEGTPFMQGVLGKHTQQLANDTIRARIAGAQGVVQVNNFTSTLNADTRHITMSCDLDTIYGPTAVDIQNRTLY